MFNLFSRKKQTNTQTIWVKKGYDDGSGRSDLFIFTDSKTTNFRDSVEVISSCNFPALQGMKYDEVREVEIRIKGGIE